MRWLLWHNVSGQHESDSGMAGSYFVKCRSSNEKWKDTLPWAGRKSKPRGLTSKAKKKTFHYQGTQQLQPNRRHGLSHEIIPSFVPLKALLWIPNVLPDLQIRETQMLMNRPWASSSMGHLPSPSNPSQQTPRSTRNEAKTFPRAVINPRYPFCYTSGGDESPYGDLRDPPLR